MTTAEKITAGIALLGALGVGAVIHALVAHRLNRDERKANVADRFVQMATAMTARLSDQLSEVQRELAEAKRENAELRAELEATKAASMEDSERLRSLERKASSASSAIDQAAVELNSVRNDVAAQWSPDSIQRFVADFLVKDHLRHRHSQAALLAALAADAPRQRRRKDESPEDSVGVRN